MLHPLTQRTDRRSVDGDSRGKFLFAEGLPTSDGDLSPPKTCKYRTTAPHATLPRSGFVLGREADVTGSAEGKFPNDLSAHHFHVGRIISVRKRKPPKHTTLNLPAGAIVLRQLYFEPALNSLRSQGPACAMSVSRMVGGSCGETENCFPAFTSPWLCATVPVDVVKITTL